MLFASFDVTPSGVRSTGIVKMNANTGAFVKAYKNDPLHFHDLLTIEETNKNKFLVGAVKSGGGYSIFDVSTAGLV